MIEPIRDHPPEWVFFDAGETLIRPHPSLAGAIVEICADEGLRLSDDEAHAVADARIRRFIDLVAAHEDGHFSHDPEESRRFWIRFYIEFLGELGVEPDRAESLGGVIYSEMTQPHRYRVFDDVLPLMDALARAGIQMALVSNWEAFLDGMLDDLGIGGHLEVRAISGIEGIEKPNPEIYRRALKRAGADPSEVVHIGDDPRSDAEPAAALGMGAILIDRRGRHPDSGWPTITTLDEVRSLIAID